MLEHTKKPPTDGMRSICIRVPEGEAEAAVSFLRSQGYTIADDDRERNAPSEEVLGEITPGRLLRGARHREGMTQQALADAVDCKKHHISEMENGKRPIGKQNARKLGKALNVDPRRFLSV